MELTEHQKLTLCHLVNGVRIDTKPIQTLGGYAGTGKTTLIKYLVHFFPNFGVCAYTGKAANVLRKKGIAGASTIHSRIYKAFFDNGAVYFDLTDDPGCFGFIVDEASMVSEDIYVDLLSFGLPMIFVGDHGQLEPVGSDFNLMKAPDFKLEEIHRNAGEIAHFAEHIRKGFKATSFKTIEKVEFVQKRKLTDDVLVGVDQIICAYNKTRVAINTRVRKALGFEGVINVGERVMCLRNNKQLGLFNGMQGVVINLYTGKWGRRYMDFEYDGIVYKDIWYDQKQFGKEKYDIEHGRDTPNPFDYAACITAHKAQGDEWDKVLVLEQKCANWSHKRWGYTAASRAREKVLWSPDYF